MTETYTVPTHRLAPIRQVLAALDGARDVVLTTHLNADGDGAGSEIALAAFLRERGTDAWIVNPTPFPRMYRFLLPDDTWVVPASDPEAGRLCRKADVAVVLDTGEVSRIGRVKPMIGGRPIVVVDHHPAGENPIEGIGFRDATACATGELVYDLIRVTGGPWLPESVTGLYVALLTDTGSFRHSNTTPACHRIVADLIERGADPAAIYRSVYGAVPLRKLRLQREALATLDQDGGVAWMTIPQAAFHELKAEPDDLEGLVDLPRSLQGVEVALLFRRIAGGGIKVSFRSNGDVDVNALARTFDGGGHVRAAGAVVKGTLEEVRERVIEATRAAVRESSARTGAREDEEPTREE